VLDALECSDQGDPVSFLMTNNGAGYIYHQKNVSGPSAPYLGKTGTTERSRD